MNIYYYIRLDTPKLIIPRPVSREEVLSFRFATILWGEGGAKQPPTFVFEFQDNAHNLWIFQRNFCHTDVEYCGAVPLQEAGPPPLNLNAETTSALKRVPNTSG